MQGPELLNASEDCWTTAIGGWFPGERVVLRGKDLFQDFRGLPWMGLLLYGITGRIPDDKQIRLFEGIWSISASFPDPRLWNNRVAALAGTARSTAVLGVGAATSISEATIYGHRPLIKTIDLLYRLQRQLEQGTDLDQLVRTEMETRHGVIGYGRPIHRNDERIPPLLALARELGFADGKHVRLAFAIEEVLRRGRWRMHMNIAALIAGLAADQGLSPEEHYRFMVLCFSAGMFPCHIDAMNKPEGTLFPLRCERIAYKGPARRAWASA